MKKLIYLLFLLQLATVLESCGSKKQHNEDQNPDKAPMFRPIYHSKDTATA